MVKPEVGDIFQRNNKYDDDFYGNYIIVVTFISDTSINFRRIYSPKQVLHEIGGFEFEEFDVKFDRILYD